MSTPSRDGFALDFAGGKMFFTTDTGAKFVYGPILDKYEALGGPAGSDLGFPTINEVPGLAGTGQPSGHLLRQRQAGHFLDARPRCVRRARRP